MDGAGGSHELPPVLLSRCGLAWVGAWRSSSAASWWSGAGPRPTTSCPCPPDEADLVDEVKAEVVYWGVVPVHARIGDTEFTTAMFPREDTWFLPVKAAVRRAEGIGLGEVVDVRLGVGR